jgi:preprotein translocase subunit SecG
MSGDKPNPQPTQLPTWTIYLFIVFFIILICVSIWVQYTKMKVATAEIEHGQGWSSDAAAAAIMFS